MRPSPFILTVAFLLAAFSALAQPYYLPLQVSTNGTLRSPTNFFRANEIVRFQDLPGKITNITFVRIGTAYIDELFLPALTNVNGVSFASLTDVTNMRTLIVQGPVAGASTNANGQITYTNAPGSSAPTNANPILSALATNSSIKTVSGSGITITDQTTNLLFTAGSSSGAWTNTQFLIGDFYATDNKPPTNSPATFGTLGTGFPVDVLNFSDTTQQAAVFRSRVPVFAVLTNGISIRVDYAATNTTGTIGWQTALRVLSGNTPTVVWGITNTITTNTVPSVAQTITNSTTTYTLSNLPSGFTNGSIFELLIMRDVANDTSTGTNQLVGARINTL